MHTAPSPSIAAPAAASTAPSAEDANVQQPQVLPLTLAELQLADGAQPLAADDVPILVEIRFGSTRIDASLALESGQLVVLQQDIAAPVELVAAGGLIARGELVTQDGCLGVQVVEIVSPADAREAAA